MVIIMPKKYYTRIIENELDQLLGIFGAVLIEGPKWCGKTTTAETRAASRLLLMDPSRNFENRLRAETDPALAVSGEVPRLIDEWQEVPKLWDAARFECDNRGGEPGQFIFTGSATPRDDKRPMHSGAGRFAKLRMDTMTLFELGKSSGAVKLSGIISGKKFNGAFGSLDSASIAECVVRGGWPAAVGHDARAASAMAKRYIDIVAEEDLSRVDGSRRDPEKVKAVIESLARNESTLATLKTLVADLGGEVSRQTASSYISLLARVNFVRDIPAWSPAMRSPVHLRESKKHHLADPSLAAAALGATPETLLLDFKTLGLLFESLALHDLWVYAQANGMGLYHSALLKSKRRLTVSLLSRSVWSLPETTRQFRKSQSLDLAHKPMSLTAASKLFRWMFSRRSAIASFNFFCFLSLLLTKHPAGINCSPGVLVRTL